MLFSSALQFRFRFFEFLRNELPIERGDYTLLNSLVDLFFQISNYRNVALMRGDALLAIRARLKFGTTQVFCDLAHVEQGGFTRC